MLVPCIKKYKNIRNSDFLIFRDNGVPSIVPKFRKYPEYMNSVKEILFYGEEDYEEVNLLPCLTDDIFTIFKNTGILEITENTYEIYFAPLELVFKTKHDE